MNSQIIQQYDSPHQFEPLMPAEPMLATLLERAGDLMRKATALGAAAVKSGVREEALLPLHYLFATQGELGRAQFKAMTGLGDRVATATLSALLVRGFLTTDSPYGGLRFGIPRHALRFYFPALWPEAEQDQDLLDGQVGLAAVPRGTSRRSSPV